MDDRRTLRVHQKTWQADGVTSLTLVDPSGADLPSWEPGAHVSLHLPNGLVREYSLCSDPQDRRTWTVAVLREPTSRGGSSYIHDGLPIGTLLDVTGPRNAFTLEDTASRYILIAGGIGITPVVAMLRHLDSTQQDWRLLYAGRSRSTMAFIEEISGYPPERVTIHADDEDNGYPDIAAQLAEIDSGALVYCCGPETLIEACHNALADPAQLRIERFKAPQTNPAHSSDTAFDVVIASTGARIPVDAHTSVLDALNTAGVELDSSCTEGICGTCEVAVLKGDIDHRDFVLTPDEQANGATMMACVSRCNSAELVLDL